MFFFKKRAAMEIEKLLKLTVNNQPNINILNEMLRDLPAIRLNIKNFGYLLAKDLRDAYEANAEVPVLEKIGLRSKSTTQKDLESNWVRYWCKLLKIEPLYHRKIWELCYVPQAIFEHHDIDKELKGIGFGCGEEPLPSLFASLGHEVTVTDLEPEKARGLGWAETKQYTQNLEKVYYKDITDQTTFEFKVSLKYVDMNQIPKEMDRQYDYCWSVCALEHLGSIKKGLIFIENSLRVLKSGGVAVHTTEYNYTNEKEPIDNWPTVTFQRKHFEEITNRLRNQGHFVAELDFDVGNKPLDRFVDIPPYNFGEGWLTKETWGDVNQGAHLKLSVDGFPCTCFGIIIKKK